MLLANMAVAQRIWRAFPDRALLRRHPSPKDKSAWFLVCVCVCVCVCVRERERERERERDFTHSLSLPSQAQQCNTLGVTLDVTSAAYIQVSFLFNTHHTVQVT